MNITITHLTTVNNMSSIACLRALLEDQKQREVDLLKQLIEIKNKAAEEPKIDIKIHQSILSEMQFKVEHLLQQESSLNLSLENAKSLNFQLQSEIGTLHQNLYSIQIQNQTAFERLSEYERLNKDLEERLVHLNYSTNVLKSDLSAQKNEVELRDGSLLQLKSELKLSKDSEITQISKVQQLEGEIIGLKQSQNTLNLQLRTELSNMTHLTQEYSALKLNHELILGELEAAKRRNLELETECTTNLQLIETSQSYLEQWHVAGQNYDSQLAAIRLQLEKSVQKVQEKDSLLQSNQNLLAEATSRALYNEQKLDQQTSQANSLNNENFILHSRLEHIEQALASSQSLENQAEQRINNLLSERALLERQMSAELLVTRSRLSKQEDETLVLSLENKQLLTHLDQLTSFQATQQSEFSRKESTYKDQINGLQSELSIASEHLTQWNQAGANYEAAAAENTQRILHLKQEIEQLKIECSSQAATYNTQIVEHSQAISNLQSEHNFKELTWTSNIEKLNQELSGLKLAYDQTDSLKESLSNQLNEAYEAARQDKEGFSKDLDRLHSQIALSVETECGQKELILKLEEEMTQLNGETEGLKEEIQQLQCTLTEKKIELSCLTQTINELKSRDSEAKASIAELEDQMRVRLSQLNSAQESRKASEEQLQDCSSRILLLESQLTTEKLNLSEALTQIESARLQAEEFKSASQYEESRMLAELDELKKKCQEQAESLNLAISNLEKWTEAGVVYETQLEQFRAYIDTLGREKSALENMIQQCNQRNMTMESRLNSTEAIKHTLEKKLLESSSQYNMERDAAVVRITRFEKIAQDRDNEINRLRTEIKRLEAEYGGVTTQQIIVSDDLSKSIHGESQLQELCAVKDSELLTATENNLRLIDKVATLELEFTEAKKREELYTWEISAVYQRCNELDQTVYWLQEQLQVAVNQLQQWQHLAGSGYEARFAQVRNELQRATLRQLGDETINQTSGITATYGNTHHDPAGSNFMPELLSN